MTAAMFEGLGSMVPGYAAPYCRAHGPARSRWFHPKGYGLWKVSALVEAGTTLEWSAAHGDEALFVRSGELDVDAKACGRDGAVIVESGVPTVITARQTTSLVHLGPIAIEPPADGPLGAPATEGRGLHAFDHADAEACRTGHVTFYADGWCPTCRTMLFTVDRRGTDEAIVGSSHVHSADEIIHVLDGEISVGPITVPAGCGVAVPGGLRYGYRASRGFRFLNYRADACTIVHQPGTTPELESRERMATRVGGRR